MLPLIWHPEALEDLEEIVDFIEARNPLAAQRIGDAIRRTRRASAGSPLSYRPSRIADTGEAVVHPNISWSIASAKRSKFSPSSTPASNTPERR